MELLVRLLREFEAITASSCGTAWRAWWRDSNRRRVTRKASACGEQRRGKLHGNDGGLGPEGLLQVEREDGRLTTVIAGDVAEAR